MPKFRRKAVVLEASQWFKHGDHPSVQPINNDTVNPLPDWTKEDLDDLIMGGTNPLTIGLIPTLEGAHIVRPGDWIMTGTHGEHYPIKPDIFPDLYEPVD